MRWKEVTPDPVTYKPGMPVLEPVNVFVDVPIPADMVSREEGSNVHLSPLGMAYATKQLKIAMMAIEDNKKEIKRS